MAEQSPVLEEKQQDYKIDPPKYSQEEEKYLSGLRTRMEQAKNSRESQHDEFDGAPYSTHYELNERLANTYIAPKRNKEDTNFQSGIVRQKLFALLSPIINLNLKGDISAFDKDGLEIQSLGDAMEDIILKTDELDADDENKFLRHYDLLKQGTVFVEEVWAEMMRKKKKMNGKFKGNLDVTWTEKLEKAFARPHRSIIPGINVYLGDLTKYDISEQPYFFTVEVKPYEECKKIFGEWERWKSVPRKLVQTNETITTTSLYNPNWRLLDQNDHYVEIIRYQDKWNNEFAVLLNGVLMTPVGLPLPWGYEDYNVAQQNLEPIHSKFAYGKSLVARIRNKTLLLDEMWKLMVLKTQKSFMPPYVNISGRVLSNRVLMPGKITYGIQPGTLAPLNEKEVEGVTQAEFNIVKGIEESIDVETVSPTFQGQQAQGNPTATEVIELQRQAKLQLGLTIFAVSMLEWKLEWLRLKNILAHWFNAEDQVVDESRQILKEKYRQVSVERSVEGEGMGRRILIPTKEIPSGRAIKQAEDALTEEQGVPVRLIFLNPSEVTKAHLIWQIVVKPKEKKTSEISKLMFREFVNDVLPLGANMENLQEEAALIWEKDPKKLFAPNPMQMQPGMEGEQPSKTNAAGINLPSPAGVLGKQTRTEAATNV